MMGRLSHDQEQFFYSFRLDEAVPEDHAVREIAAVLDLSWAHSELAPYYPEIGRPSIDPVLMIRMLIVSYVFGIRSERALCREVQVNLAYRWFCGLSIEDKVPDHSAFSRARNERFGDSNVFRCVFERIVGTCIAAGLVGGEGFAVDASLIQADANKHRSIPGAEWHKDIDPEQARRAVKEYLATVDAPAYGAASDVTPKFVSPSDPAAQWTGALTQRSVLRIRQQLSRRRKVWDYHGCRSFARHPAGRGRCLADDDRTDRSLLRHQTQMARGGQRLWFRLQPRLAGQRAGDRAACPSHRQIAA